MEFQSTLPRGERQVVLGGYAIVTAISIHAPARGATDVYTKRDQSTGDFNPRSREGSD